MSQRSRLTPALGACLLALAAGCPAGQKPGAATGPVATAVGTVIGHVGGGTIGASGGSVPMAPGSRLTLEVPAGAVAAAVEFTVEEVANFAPDAVGSAYRIAPHGPFARPLILTFRPDPAVHSVQALAVAYQDEKKNFWVRPPLVTRDAAANAISVSTSHLSDWTLVSTPTARDLVGSFTYVQTVDMPFSASGVATLNFAGENAYEAFYMVPGSITPTAIGAGTVRCVPLPGTETQPLDAQVAEMIKPSPALWWGINAAWTVTCTDSSTGLSNSTFLGTQFDSFGINLIGCARHANGPQVAGQDMAAGSYTIDCGVNGAVTATWQFQAAACGQPCTSANPCRTAVTGCATGAAVCTESGNVPDGTSCGANLVCGAGSCVACTAGLGCSPPPDPLCHAGVTSCATGAQACVDGAALADGTPCGVDQVCSAGACVACTAGTACATQPDPLCHAGTTDCSTGSQVCVDGAALANGTSCGSGRVCNSGACVACTAGTACTTQPDPLCHLGVNGCSTGLQTCVDGAALANGTSCGPNQVCDAGACAACTAGAPCTTQPEPLCHAGVSDCATGIQACIDGAALADGTSCGANRVCSAGACVPCTAGAACTTQPDPLCHAGATSCATGAQVCANAAALADGTSCGASQVCLAGACVPCTAGAACTTQPDPLCHAGATSCATGAQVCANATALADGTSCGTNQVCSAGACVACTAGAPCTTQPDPLCHAGATRCATGAQVCADAAALANGTPCGAGQTCDAGACVPSQAVTGSRLVTYWPDSGATPPVAAPDVGAAQVSAAVPDGSGGLSLYPGTFQPDGSFSIPAVPAGSYLLVVKDGAGFTRAVQTSASSVDLGYDLLGRPDAAIPTGATPVALAVAGLLPWDATADQLQIVSSNADLWDAPASAGAVAAGAVAASLLEDWFASAGGGPLHLLATSDSLAVFQLHAASDASGTAYLSAAAAGLVAGVALVDRGSPAPTLAVALAPPATAGVLAVDWSLGAFESLLSAMSPVATAAQSSHTLRVGAAAHSLAAPAPRSAATSDPTLLRITLPAGGPASATFAAPATYGHALDPALWSEWRSAEFTAALPYTAPGATSPISIAASVIRREPMSPAPPTPIVPALGPVTAPLLDGASAFASATGVGTTPTFSWSAPATGVSSSTTVELFLLTAAGAASAAAPVASLTTAGTRIQVPPGILAAGSTYVARITATAIPSDPFSIAPYRRSGAFSSAAALTGTFTP